jgi:hypothetical protein
VFYLSRYELPVLCGLRGPFFELRQLVFGVAFKGNRVPLLRHVKIA